MPTHYPPNPDDEHEDDDLPSGDPISLDTQTHQLQQLGAFLSHDLRTPLAIATGALEVARQTNDEAAFDRTTAALRRMGELLDSLDSLIDHGTRVTDPVMMGLSDVALSAWELVATETATLRIDVPSRRMIEGDRTRVKSLFENLFLNAFKHVGPDVTLTLGVVPGGFYVEDDGSGMDASVREEAFEIGVSGTSDSRGFGLAIVAWIAEAHGWGVELTEGETGGARFEFTNVR